MLLAKFSRNRKLALLLVMAGCGRTVKIGSPVLPTTRVNDEVRTLIELINDHRKSVGCKELHWNSAVAKVAQAHSDDMVRRNYFNHNTLEGVTPAQRISGAGVRWVREAENIAAGQTTARAVLNAWLKSPGHRANIENCAYQEHGIGLTRGQKSLPYGTITNAWAHDFVRLAQ
jgi:uncharacterized protein YkwD